MYARSYFYSHQRSSLSKRKYGTWIAGLKIMSGQITPPKIACLRQKSIHLNQVTRNRTPVISQGSGIAERSAERLQQALSIAYENDKLDRLRKSDQSRRMNLCAFALNWLRKAVDELRLRPKFPATHVHAIT